MNKTVRINKYDNLKGLAIFLIVLGHMTFLTQFESIRIIHAYIYIIHLPIFFFVSGYFSKIGPNEPIKAFKRLFIPYIIFCIIWDLFNMFVLGKPHNNLLFINPGYALWFLISLFFMKLLLPIIDKFRYPVLIALIFAVLGGFLNMDILGISRTLAFLPIFLIGFYYNDYKNLLNDNISSWLEKKYVIYLLFIFTTLSCILAAIFIPATILILKNQFVVYNLTNVIYRFIIIILGIANTLLLNRLMTNRNNFLTKIGKNSMGVYVLHVYFIAILKITMRPYFSHHEKLFLITAILISMILTFVLSRDFITKGINKLTDTVFNLLCKTSEL